MKCVLSVMMATLSLCASASLVPFAGEFDITDLSEHTANSSYKVSGTFTDWTAAGYDGTDVDTNDLVFTETSQGQVDVWRITNIIYQSVTILTADVVYAESGTSTVGMVSGPAIICSRSTNSAEYAMPPARTFTQVSDHLWNAVVNYNFRLIDAYTVAQADALLDAKAGTGTVAIISGRVDDLEGGTSAWYQAATDATDATNRLALLEGATNSYVLTNNASFLSVLQSMTNYTAVAASSNYLSYNASTRTLSGCVTNGGTGTGSATNWYAYSQDGLIFRAGTGTNQLLLTQPAGDDEYVAGVYTISTNVIESRATWTNGIYTILWDADFGYPITNGWMIQSGISQWYIMTNSPAAPTGTWVGYVATNTAPTSAWYYATNYFGFEADGDFVVSDRYPLTELDVVVTGITFQAGATNTAVKTGKNYAITWDTNSAGGSGGGTYTNAGVYGTHTVTGLVNTVDMGITFTAAANVVLSWAATNIDRLVQPEVIATTTTNFQYRVRSIAGLTNLAYTVNWQANGGGSGEGGGGSPTNWAAFAGLNRVTNVYGYAMASNTFMNAGQLSGTNGVYFRYGTNNYWILFE